MVMQDIFMPNNLNGAKSFRILELEAQRASLERVLTLPNISEARKLRIRPSLLQIEVDLRTLRRGLHRMFWNRGRLLLAAR
jgi:hypothetical protein